MAKELLGFLHQPQLQVNDRTKLPFLLLVLSLLGRAVVVGKTDHYVAGLRESIDEFFGL